MRKTLDQIGGKSNLDTPQASIAPSMTEKNPSLAFTHIRKMNKRIEERIF